MCPALLPELETGYGAHGMCVETLNGLLRQPSGQPTGKPTGEPSGEPSEEPTRMPSGEPTSVPSVPSSMPTETPTAAPSGDPTCAPSAAPTQVPSSAPSVERLPLLARVTEICTGLVEKEMRSEVAVGGFAGEALFAGVLVVATCCVAVGAAFAYTHMSTAAAARAKATKDVLNVSRQRRHMRSAEGAKTAARIRQLQKEMQTEHGAAGAMRTKAVMGVISARVAQQVLLSVAQSLARPDPLQTPLQGTEEMVKEEEEGEECKAGMETESAEGYTEDDTLNVDRAYSDSEEGVREPEPTTPGRASAQGSGSGSALASTTVATPPPTSTPRNRAQAKADLFAAAKVKTAARGARARARARATRPPKKVKVQHISL